MVKGKAEPEDDGPIKKAEEIVEKYRGNKIAGGNKLTAEVVEKIRHMWGIEGIGKNEISSFLGLGINIVQESIKGVPKGKPLPVTEKVRAATRIEMITHILDEIDKMLWDIRIQACYDKSKKTLLYLHAVDDGIQRAMNLLKLEKEMQEEDGYRP